jgi:uncharacterized phage protein gp47/JayE
VKINGIARRLSSNSTATLRIVGVVGTVIERGYAGSDAGDLWALPETVTIPMAGEILVTATCTTAGAISAAAGTIDTVKEGPPGWQEVSNPEPAVPGAPVETDAQLRLRQTFSAALPELSAYEALQASVAASPGVSRYVIYQNNAPGMDENGIPGFSVAAVVEGGFDPLVAQAINLKKSCGVRTYGTTAVALGPDEFGLYHTIHFSRPASVPLTFSLKVKALSGFTTDNAARIRQTLSDWAGTQPIGAYIELATVYSIARMLDSDIAGTFRIVPDSLKIGRDGNAPMEQDLPLAYNEAPICQPAFVTITVAP